MRWVGEGAFKRTPAASSSTYHYPPLVRAGDVASIEIHRHVGEQKSIVTNQAAFRGAVELEAAGVRLKAASGTTSHATRDSRIRPAKWPPR